MNRVVRKSDLGRVLDVLGARGWKPHAVRLNPDGSVDLADVPFDAMASLDGPRPPLPNEPNDWD